MDIFDLLMGQLMASTDSGGNGIVYKAINYLEDNVIELTDTNDTLHIMKCTYDDEKKLTSIDYDGTTITLKYNDEILTQIGSVKVELENAPSIEGSIELEQENIALKDLIVSLTEEKSTLQGEIETLENEKQEMQSTVNDYNYCLNSLVGGAS